MKNRILLIATAALGGLAMTTASFADHKDGHKGEHHQEDADASDADTKVDPRLGKEVNSICFGSSINGWRGLKGEDDVVLLERGVNHWYRVELLGACDYRVFRSALAIGIDSRPRGGCITRGDTIIVEDGPGFNRRCSITRMYEWDEDAVAEENDDESEQGEMGDE